MKKIGVLFGVENTFPGALVERINSLEVEGVRAEFVNIGAARLGAQCEYAVLIDRISHDVPFYRAWLKSAALAGTYVINNPFWWSADDKFLNYELAAKLGVAVPRTVLLPHKQLRVEVRPRALRNLEYPLDWESIFEYVRFPALLKPHDGGGWRNVFHVRSREEFFAAYDRSGELCMMLQAEVKFEQYFRCCVVGQSEVLVMAYDPRRPHEQRYLREPPKAGRNVLKRVRQDSLTLCRALGYELNTVEFAVAKGTPYAIDFMNPVPDVDLQSIGEESFRWVVDAVARLAVKKARAAGRPRSALRWDSLLSSGRV